MTRKVISTIDLNTVDEDVLVKKLKISRRLADRIIALRPYQSVKQLKSVWGIDPAVLQRILPLVSISQPEIPDMTAEEAPVLPKIAPQLIEQEPKIDLQNAVSKPVVSSDMASGPSFALPSPKSEKTTWKAGLLLAVIFFIGAYFRFTGLNWDQGQHQHPDERFISMVADQIKDVNGIGAYFDTDHSPLNPLPFGSYSYGMFPLFFTHMVAEWIGMSSYDPVTIVGRVMSGLFDLFALWMLYLLGTRLYNKRIGLLAAALGAAAVLPI